MDKVVDNLGTAVAAGLGTNSSFVPYLAGNVVGAEEQRARKH